MLKRTPWGDLQRLYSFTFSLHIYLNSLCVREYPMKHLEYFILLVKHLLFRIHIIPH